MWPLGAVIWGHSGYFAEVMGVGKGSGRGHKDLVILLVEHRGGRERVIGCRVREGRKGEYRLQSEARMFGKLHEASESIKH